MAAVAPHSRIFLIEGVALSNDYVNTIWFDDQATQADWFADHVVYRFDEYSYQRWGAGKVRVQAPVDSLYGCGYMMFGNANHNPEKWFYAFVTHMEYVNEETTELTYEIDVMQTWLFDAEVRECFVEREHTYSDELYVNLVPEEFDCGDNYTVQSEVKYDFSSGQAVFALTGMLPDGSAPNPSTVASLPTGGTQEESENRVAIGVGLDYMGAFKEGEGHDTIVDRLTYYQNGSQGESLLNIYQAPDVTTFDEYNPEGAEGDYYWTVGRSGITVTVPDHFEQKIGSVGQESTDTYTPRNKKLLTYPYVYLEVTNNSDSSKEFHFEDFQTVHAESTNVRFWVYGCAYPEGMAFIVPREYMGMTEAWCYGVKLDGFPQTAWATDVYKMWLAQNTAQSNVGVVANTITSAVSGGLSFGPVGAAASAAATFFTSTANLVAKHKDLQTTTNPTSGSPGGNVAAVLTGNFKFSLYTKTVKPQFARIVDDFFDLYGYAVHRVKVPNRNVRPHWTYCKTVGMDVGGSLPADHAQKINSIYDNGIRFWVNGDEIGDYTLDNTV